MAGHDKSMCVYPQREQPYGLGFFGLVCYEINFCRCLLLRVETVETGLFDFADFPNLVV